MELHPENAGTPYAVLLGLLGRDVYATVGDLRGLGVPQELWPYGELVHGPAK